jgi:hypothetical protein
MTEPLARVFDDDRFDAIQEFADKELSLWLSIREAAYRRERATLETHCRQVRILTQAVFQTVRALDPVADASPMNGDLGSGS